MFRTAAQSFARRGPAFTRRFTTGTAEAPEPAWYEPSRLIFRWVLVPVGLATSLKEFGQGVGGAGFSKAASAPGLLERVEGTVTHQNGDVAFSYTYKDKTYTSSRVVPYPSVNPDSTPKWTEAYPNGSKQVVLVHPEFPDHGFLRKGPQDEYFVRAILGGAFALGFVSLFRRSRNASFQDLKRALRMK
eukprot:c45475_g1_i1.p1 GENE.c45475_g1_i1~~c45475_g1_i1.p1  ORF type:complete len:188 (+),score=21.75 c45475_g1_i1:25-588(+)